MDESTSTPIPPGLEFFRSLTDLLPEAFLLLETNGRVVAGNRAAGALFARADLGGCSLVALVADPPDKIERILRLWSGTGSMAPAALTLPGGPVIRADGARIGGQSPALLLLRCAPRSETFASREVIRHSLDYLSFQKNIAEKLAAAREQKQTAETTAAMFAHEVANPINGIATALDVLELEIEGASVGAAALETVKSAKQEIARLAALLRDFRALARPQALNLQPVDLGQLVGEIVAADAVRMAESAIEWEPAFPPALPPVHADRNRLKQALLNLHRNALDAMPAGGRLTISARRQNGVVVLEISDSGIGIPPGFDPFQVFKTTKARGTGLGLPIAAQIISLHKGRIEYRPRAEGGTTFAVYLPVPEPATEPS